MLRRAASLGSGGWRWKDALGACTESLGSETGDVGGDAEIDQHLGHQHAADEEEEEEARAEHQAVPPPEEKARRLPPPMPRAASMRAERRGGRLILTQVRLEPRRLDVLRASRTGGRLRLQLTAAAGSAGRESPDGEPPAAGADVVGGCGNGAGELCQVAAAGRDDADKMQAFALLS